MHTLFVDIALALVMAAGGALIAKGLKQPPLLGYLLAGFVLGPLGFHAIQTASAFKAIEEIGIALLLFLVGLELNWERSKQLATTVLRASTLQVMGSFAASYLVTLFFTGEVLPSFLIGMAVSLSSTVLVVKILSDSHDLSSLHGRLSVGTLLFHDLVALITLVIFSSLATVSAPSDLNIILLIAVKAVAFLTIIAIASRYLLPFFFTHIADSPELLFVCTLAWCFLVALIGDHYQIPLAVGAFLAGIALAPLPYTLEVVNRLKSLRDVFIILMFLSLGAATLWPSSEYLSFTLILGAIVIIGKPLLSFTLLTNRGYKHRTSFLTAVSQGQLSEFSLLIIALGLSKGLVSPELASSISLIAAVSLFTSTIGLAHRDWWYLRIRALLHHVAPPKRDREPDRMLKDHIIVFGYHRMGYHILKKLKDDKKHHVVVVDFNPEIIKKLESQEIDAVYGDIQDEDILHYLQVERASMVISTIPHREETLYLIEQVRAVRDDIILIVTSHQIDDALDYYQKGASYVILPHLLGGEFVANLITTYEQHHMKDLIAQQAEEVKLLKAKNNSLYYE